MDPIAATARHHHAQSLRAGELAARHRNQRDELIRRLRSEDPKQWTYEKLAQLIGVSWENIRLICKR